MQTVEELQEIVAYLQGQFDRAIEDRDEAQERASKTLKTLTLAQADLLRAQAKAGVLR